MIEVFKIADIEYKTLKKPSSFYQLNFLFKIALLTHKCLHGCALTCLKNLINLFASVLTKYSLRVNNDYRQRSPREHILKSLALALP